MTIKGSFSGQPVNFKIVLVSDSRLAQPVGGAAENDDNKGADDGVGEIWR